MGQLIPIACIPVLPGDTIGHHTNALVRVSPLAAPVMHKVDVRIHHFYVANRTLWEPWENFITGGEDGMNTDKVDTIEADGVAGGLLDHLGVPPVPGAEINALPIRAYNFIFNEFYRDQDLSPLIGGTSLELQNIAWGKDYLNTARPWSQKGPAVSIPLGDSALIHTGAAEGTTIGIISDAEGSNDGRRKLNHQTGTNVKVDPDVEVPGNIMYADLSNAIGADPIDVRRAWGMQRFMENAAQFGSRYPEKMRQLGSTYKGLMDRPLYLGGGSQSVNFSEVLQTAPEGTGRDFGVGDMYGHGIAATRTNKYAHRVQEHGYVMSLLSVRPQSIYQHGIHREWLRQDREDFHDPFLDLIGQQEVWRGEAWFIATGNQNTFGYSDRYDEYRSHPSNVSSEFRDVLDYWHLARQYDAETPPVLNDDFVKCVPTKRIHNEQTQHALWVMAHHSIAAHRNIPAKPRARLL